ncbi:MAG TPA: GDSL-type esterase/lipase family protein [Planctomycetota bacterium]|nr:GDSL-type esterase/lipase family protein [Planctomycetota bacterium]
MLGLPFPTSPFAWHRVTFRAKAPTGGMIAAVSLDPEGKPLDADHHTGIDASADWTEQSFCTRAKAGATHAVIRVNPPSLADRVRDVTVEPASGPAVAEWADAVWSTMPPLVWDPPPDRSRHLPAVSAALSESRVTRHASRLRVVMLGDSIVNDTGNSPWEVLVERHHPGLRLEVVTSVRGGTGCWYYQDEGRVKPYVLDYAPDLLMIGGISHNADTEAIRSVIRRVREHIQPDIVLMTGAFGKGRDPRTLPGWSPVVRPDGDGYRSRLMALAIKEGCEFLDLEGAWGAYLLGIRQPYAWLMRDEVHANARGAQVLARILERFFAPSR